MAVTNVVENRELIAKEAHIHPSAVLAPDVQIGPYTIIGPDVCIKSGTVIASHVVIKGPTTIGENCKIYQFASIGEDCQDKKYGGERTSLEIGDNNIFREGCTVHRGTMQGGGFTKIGNDNLFMVHSHVAHDCIIGNNVIFSNGASIAGHVVVEDYASLGGLVGVHQFCSIGKHSFAAGGTIIYKDVLPFSKVSGVPAKSYGLNIIGLERRGFTPEDLKALHEAYRIVFRTSHTVQEALTKLESMVPSCAHISLIIDFMRKSARGIVR